MRKPRKMTLNQVMAKGYALAVWHVEQCGAPDLQRWDEHTDLFEQKNRETMTAFDMHLAMTYAMAALRYDNRGKPEYTKADGTLVKCGLWAGRVWGNVTEQEAA
jgi:hypothetical protein